ncbi:MAG: hypothetical protein GXO46_08840 [Chlorobi bacterium]|nr:hypothetical protein [Chlorobiota bacterium]
MKNLFYIILLLSSIISCKAQQVYEISQYDPHVEDGRYFKDISGKLNKYIGVWKNTTGNKTFKITLWKEEKRQHTGFYMDQIYGDYEMIENEGQPNETLLYKSKKIADTQGNYMTPSIFLFGFSYTLYGSVYDLTNFHITYGYSALGELKFSIDPTTGKAHWTVTDKRELKDPSEGAITIPMDLIMTKQ